MRRDESRSLVLSARESHLLARLEDHFGPRRREVLAERRRRQEAWDRGITPDFRFDTAAVRKNRWRVAPLPPLMKDRRVEIIVPASGDAFDAALASHPSGIVVDFEDALSPTSANLAAGQRLLEDYWRRCSGATTEPLVTVRVRGWHLEDRHVLGDGEPMSAALVDAGLYVLRNAAQAAGLGRPLHLCLPKLEHADEARLWADVLDELRNELGLEDGSLRCSIIIETLPAVFQMDEIAQALADYVVGLHAGRWDYLFSFIKTFRTDMGPILGDRASLTASQPFLHAYARLLIDTAHRRGMLAIGGTGTMVPTELDREVDMTVRARVRQEKLSEVTLGFDGTWVAHPGLVAVARDVFDEHMPQSNQAYRVMRDQAITAPDLLSTGDQQVSLDGVRANLRAAIRYLAAWLAGAGTVVIDGRLEHLGTAEICRAQLWQWLHRQVELDDGRHLNETLFDHILAEQVDAARREAFIHDAYLERAKDLVSDLVKADELAAFINDKACEELP